MTGKESATSLMQPCLAVIALQSTLPRH